METDVQFFYSKGLAKSTLRTYQSGKDRYTKFCTEANINPLPVSEQHLCFFVSFLAKQGLKHQTIECYLSAIRHLQISNGLKDPFLGELMPKLDYVLRGIKKHQAEQSSDDRTRLPITPTLLSKMREVWEDARPGMDITMIWAACSLAFFGFLRLGELTVPSDNDYDPQTHLGLADITFDHPTRPSSMAVLIKQSKTDPFRKGVTLSLGRTFSKLCPVAAMATYITQRGQRPGPLFQFQDGRFLTRKRMVDYVQQALLKAKVDAGSYNGHSFRIGAATTAAAKGLEDSLIKTLGRWESTAYLRYVRIPREQLASYTSILAS